MKNVQSKMLLLSALTGLVGLGAWAAEPAAAAKAAPEKAAPEKAAPAKGKAKAKADAGEEKKAEEKKPEEKKPEEKKVEAAPAAAGDAAGLALFEKKCGSCHGKDGKGKTKMGEKLKIRDMSSAEFWKDQTDEKLEKAVVDGISDKKMPSFKDKLTPDEVKSLVKAIHGFQAK